MFRIGKPNAYEIENQKAAARVAILTAEAHLKVQLLEDAAGAAHTAIGQLWRAMLDGGTHEGREFFDVQEGSQQAYSMLLDVRALFRRLPADYSALPHIRADDGDHDPFRPFDGDEMFTYEETADVSKTAN